VRGQNRSTQDKTSRSRVENQLTQSPYDGGMGNRTRTTLVEGESSRHCANPALKKRASNQPVNFLSLLCVWSTISSKTSNHENEKVNKWAVQMCLNPWNNCWVFNAKECVMRYPNTAPRFFNQLLSVWMSDETHFLVFDILHLIWNIRYISKSDFSVSGKTSFMPFFPIFSPIVLVVESNSLRFQQSFERVRKRDFNLWLDKKSMIVMWYIISELTLIGWDQLYIWGKFEPIACKIWFPLWCIS